MTETITTPITKLADDSFKVDYKITYFDSPEVRLEPQGVLSIAQIDSKITDLQGELDRWQAIKTTCLIL